MVSAKHQEPELTDPRTLEPGDLIGCNGAGVRLQVLVGEHHADDAIWLALGNAPGETTHVHESPVGTGQVALELTGQGWTVAVLPQVLARRAIG